jgi:hypothetical protein
MARIPAATGAGTGVFEKAMALHLREVSELLIELPRAMSRVEGLVTADKTSAADEQDSAALLRDIAATLKEIRDFLLPTDGREETACMRSDQMDDWETRLHAVLPALANVRLSWLAYLLRKMACN